MKAAAEKMAKIAKQKYTPPDYSEAGGINIPKPRPLPSVAKNEPGKVAAISAAVSKENSRYAFNGVHFDGRNLEATDGRRAFIITKDKGTWGKDGIYAVDGKGNRVGDAVEGNFPPLKDVLPDSKEKPTTTIDIATTIRRLRQAETMAVEGNPSVLWAVNPDGSLAFAVHNPSVGHFEINYQDGAKELGAINPRFLRESLEFHFKTTGKNQAPLWWTAPNRPILIKQRGTGETVQSVTMPVNSEGKTVSAVRDQMAAPADFVPDPPATGTVMGHGASPAENAAPTPATERTGGRQGKVSAFLDDRSFVGGDVVPTAQNAVNGFYKTWKWLQRTFAPQTQGPQAREAGNMLRARLGEQAQREEQVKAAMAQAHRFFESQPREDNYDFIDRFQAGEKQSTPALDSVAELWRKINKDQTDRLDALDPTIQRQWEENHLKQMWKESATDPGKVESVIARIMSQRRLEGDKGFLKQKTFATYKAGREAGLTPLMDNPVDLMLYGFSEAEKFIQMRRLANYYRNGGPGVFVSVYDKVPEGNKIVDDPAFHVYGSPTISVNEYVNKSVWEALNAVGGKLGLDIKTKMTLPEARGAAGYMKWGTPETVRRFGTDLGVLAHEISHQMDARFDLKGRFLTSKYAEDLRAVADLHGYRKDYFRTADEKMASILEAYVAAPESFRQKAPLLYRDFVAWMEEHPETYPILELERGLGLQKLSSEISVPGIRKLGSYAIPAEAADVIMNHLTPGLRNVPVFRVGMALSNRLNQIQLAGFFHAGFTSADAAISRGALAFEQLANGKPLAAARSFATAPIAPFSNAYYGHQLIQEYLKPGSYPEYTPIVNALVEGGSRIKMDSALQTKVRDRFMRAWRQGNLLGAVVRIPDLAHEALSWPVMEKLVPMQKWGVMGDLMHEELQRMGDNATPDQIREAARKVVDSVDNRMGQVVYDNLFMNRKAKDALMGTMRSVGWNLGTFRELGGAVTDAPGDIAGVSKGNGFGGHRLPYALSLLTMTAVAGALYQYLKTGQYPQELKDYYFPKTGRTDENGEDIRVQLPTYMRDLAHLGHGGITKVPSNFVDMAGGKMSPLLAATFDLIRNHDYYGTRITDPLSSMGQKSLDRAKFIAKQAVPFTVQSWQKQGDDVPADERAAAMVGITPAPKKLSRTEAEDTAAHIRDGKGDLIRTPEQSSKAKLMAELARSLRGGKADAGQKIQQAIDAGQINAKDAQAIQKHAKMMPLQRVMEHLTADEAVRVYQDASGKEKQAIRRQVINHILNAERPDDEQDSLLKTAGIEKPADLEMNRRYRDLLANARNWSKGVALIASGEPDKAREVLRGIRRPTDEDKETLNRIVLARKYIKKVREMQDGGKIDDATAEKRVGIFVNYVSTGRLKQAG